MKAWARKTIGELCDIGGGQVKTGPFGSQLHQSDYQETGIPVVMPTDIAYGKIAVTRIARVSETYVDRLHKHKLSKGDIVYGRRGDIGRQALVREENVGWLCGTGCLRISLGRSEVLSEFLHRYLSMPEIVGWIEGQAVGATMPNLNTAILRRVPIYFPESKNTQKKITAILSAYDDLIENNKRRIVLLEKMADEIYREWFVRMRFPGHEETKFVKGVPINWEFKRATKYFAHVKGKSYTSEEVSNNSENMPFINLKCFNRGGGYRSDGIKFYSGKYSDKQLVTNGDIVMAVTDMTQNREVIGRVAKVPELNGKHGIISLDVIKLVPKAISRTFLYCYLRYSGFSNFIKEFANGANVLHLKPELVTSQRILLPPEDLQSRYVQIVAPIYSQVDLLTACLDRLKEVRDALLPRLISGKLSVEDLDIQFPPSMREGAQMDKREREPIEA